MLKKERIERGLRPTSLLAQTRVSEHLIQDQIKGYSVSEIVTALQRSGQVYVYGTGQRQLCAVFAGNGPEDGLKGYTSSTVSVRRGNTIYVYNAKGQQISSVYAG